MKRIDILNEIADKYGEHLEMAGEQFPAMLIERLCQMVIDARLDAQFYKKFYDAAANQRVA